MSVKKKATKKPSAKQLAARKKFAAAAKARAKTAKKATAKKWTKKADGTRTRTSAAKKARKAKNTVEGYYPNPDKFYVVALNSSDKKPYYWSALLPTKTNKLRYAFSSSKADMVIYDSTNEARAHGELIRQATELEKDGFIIKVMRKK